MEWQPIVTAPFDRDLEVSIIGAKGVYAVVFPCRRVPHGWVKAETNMPVKIYPTHWREWIEAKALPLLN